MAQMTVNVHLPGALNSIVSNKSVYASQAGPSSTTYSKRIKVLIINQTIGL